MLATRSLNRLASRSSLCRTLIVLVSILIASPAWCQSAPRPPAADPEQAVDGLFVTVRNPIDTTAVNRVKALVGRFLDRPDHHGLKLVFDFNPDGYPSCTSDYGTCRDLAVFLLDLQDVATIAFVHNEVAGHTVLPVLACQEIVMSHKARLGNALRGQTRPLEQDQTIFYKTVAERRRRMPAAVLKMIDKNTALPDGQLEATDMFDAAQAEKLGLCEIQLDSRQEVKDAYRLPTSSLREDPLQGRSPDAWRIIVRGPVNQALKETMERRIQRAISRGANVIIFQLECQGGETEVARDLADFIRARKDDKGEEPIMTVAYVTPTASDTATFLALGCSEIVIDDKAHLGGFERMIQDRPRYADAIGRSLADLADKQGYPAILARGMLDPNLVIREVWVQKGKLSQRQLVDDRVFQEDQKQEHLMKSGPIVKPAGEFLVLDSAAARRYDLAKFVFDGKPHEVLPWLRDHYGLQQLNDTAPDWLDGIAEFLCRPAVSLFLVTIGIIGLILELKIPGVGLPGVIAALCFVLYFWAHHDQMRGHLTMLALLLFLLGLILIALEVFVVPGLGIVGISGIILVVVSLGLVTLVKKPETTEEWLDFGTTLTSLGMGLVASVVAAMVIAWYLPHIPYASRLVLAPPTDAVEEAFAEDTRTQAMAALLGTVGEAMTTLRPAGKALFGDELIDVIAEGSYVLPGARVQVIEIEGNRIVVKEV